MRIDIESFEAPDACTAEQLAAVRDFQSFLASQGSDTGDGFTIRPLQKSLVLVRDADGHSEVIDDIKWLSPICFGELATKAQKAKERADK